MGRPRRRSRGKQLAERRLPQPAVAQLEHEIRRDPSQERVVVAHHEHRAAIRRDRLDQLIRRVEIEVVRRLVEYANGG